jgi:hypothetical protein
VIDPCKVLTANWLTFGAVRTLLARVPVLLAGRVGGGAHPAAHLPHVLHRGQILRLVVLQPALHDTGYGIKYRRIFPDPKKSPKLFKEKPLKNNARQGRHSAYIYHWVNITVSGPVKRIREEFVRYLLFRFMTASTILEF